MFYLYSNCRWFIHLHYMLVLFHVFGALVSTYTLSWNPSCLACDLVTLVIPAQFTAVAFHFIYYFFWLDSRCLEVTKV